jgi:hypothetical protein
MGAGSGASTSDFCVLHLQDVYKSESRLDDEHLRPTPMLGGVP